MLRFFPTYFNRRLTDCWAAPITLSCVFCNWMRKRVFVILVCDGVHEKFFLYIKKKTFYQSVIAYCIGEEANLSSNILICQGAVYVHANISFSCCENAYSNNTVSTILLSSLFSCSTMPPHSPWLLQTALAGVQLSLPNILACCALQHKSRVKHDPVDKQKAFYEELE